MRSWNSPVPAPQAHPAPGHLRLFDTASRTIVPVGPEPAEGRPATMYVCGITPYDATHMGHAFTYLTFDLVNRVWRDLGLAVNYAQNITDVDDPLLERAADTGVDWQDLAASEVDLFRSDMLALRIIAPNPFRSVTEALPEIGRFLTQLKVDKQIYQIDDDYPDWYFSFGGRPDFGAESHLSQEQMLPIFADHGGDPSRKGKHHPLDALVWRQARPGEPAWDSDLGRGRPGWHIECVAIACSALGVTVDLQGGGADLIFPHHEMCAAQAQAVTGQPFARCFVHSAMVGLDGEKMSKSRGNLVKVSQLLAHGADPMAIRIALLGQHYRTDWQWDDTTLALAASRLALWRSAIAGPTSVDATPALHLIRGFLREDLHADKALDVIDTWAAASLAATLDHLGARQQIAELADDLLGVALA